MVFHHALSSMGMGRSRWVMAVCTGAGNLVSFSNDSLRGDRSALGIDW